MKATKKLYGTVSNVDPEEFERLLMKRLPQVHYIARRIRERLPQHVALEDLVQAGTLGLIDALHKYDPSKNVQLKSYAKFRIRGAILDSLREMDWSPRDLRKKARRVEQAQHELKAQLGRTPTKPEIAIEMGIDLDELHRVLSDLRGLDLGSLQAQSSEDGSEEELCRYLPNALEDGPFYLCLRSEMKELLARAIGELPPQERQVLALYYFEELTMKEVGAVLGVGESRISQIHSGALLRVRAQMQPLPDPFPLAKLHSGCL